MHWEVGKYFDRSDQKKDCPTHQVLVFGLMSSIIAFTTSVVVAFPQRSGVWNWKKCHMTDAIVFFLIYKQLNDDGFIDAMVVKI